MDAQNTINEVVDGVKSEGLFDQFRKECLEEFENMDTYHQLKQRVENHVTSFLSKHKYHERLQKNTLRSDLRSYISKSDVLLNGITQLVDEVLSIKGKSFCLRIDKQVDKHLNKNTAPPVPPVKPDTVINNNNDQNKSNQSKVTSGQGSSTGDRGTLERNDACNKNDKLIKEEPKEVVCNETITEFSEMEIEEVEMDLSDNHEENDDHESKQIKTLSDNSNSVDMNECVGSKTNTLDTEIKVKSEVDVKVEKVENINVTPQPPLPSNDLPTKEIKIETDNVFQPIKSEVKNQQDKNELEKSSSEKKPVFKSNESDEPTLNKNDQCDVSNLNLPPIITEPITDDSNSNDSIETTKPQVIRLNEYSVVKEEPSEKKEDLDDGRRKSSRVRTLPLKFRELDEVKKRSDDADSVSSNEIDYKDLEDGTYLTGKRGKSRKRPASAGNPERQSSASPSLSKQEEQAINFLTKPDVRKSISRENKSSSVDTDVRKSKKKSRERKLSESRESSVDPDDRKSKKKLRERKLSESRESSLDPDDRKSKKKSRERRLSESKESSVDPDDRKSKKKSREQKLSESRESSVDSAARRSKKKSRERKLSGSRESSVDPEDHKSKKKSRERKLSDSKQSSVDPDDRKSKKKSRERRVSESRRDGNISDKEHSDRYSRDGSRRKSESKDETSSEHEDRKSSDRDRKSQSSDISSCSKDDRRSRKGSGSSWKSTGSQSDKEDSRSKRDRKSESRDSIYSNVDNDDKDHKIIFRYKRDKEKESRDSNEDWKSRDRRDGKSSGGEDRGSSRDRRESNNSDKDDSNIKPRTKIIIKTEENMDNREDKDSGRKEHRKRLHSPVPSIEGSQSKRSRRTIKERQRYSPD